MIKLLIGGVFSISKINGNEKPPFIHSAVFGMFKIVGF